MSETIKVWRYSKPGILPLPVTVKRDSKPGRNRWRGETICGSDNCGDWVSDIDPSTLATSLPLPCPGCEARSGYPELLWRETALECTFCGTESTCLIVDPADPWPKRVDCPECDAPIDVPLLGRALFH